MPRLLATILALAAAASGVSGFFLAPVAPVTMKAGEPSQCEPQQQAVSRKDVLAAGGSALLGGALLGGLAGAPLPANAGGVLAQRKALYFRYAPRIKAGRDFFATDLKKAIDGKDWKKVLSTFELEKQSAEGSLRKNDLAKINYWEKNMYSPMKVYAQCFSEKGTSPKLVALLNAEAEFEAAINRLENVAKGDLKKPKVYNEGVLFGLIGGGEVDTGADKYAGLSQDKMAQALYADAKAALNDYFTNINKNLGLELNKFELV